MEAVGIAGKAGSFVAEPSDGERQKAMIAKALAQQCPVILLDEPTAFLDIISRIEVMNLLYRLAREEHKAVLLSTHDVDQALLLADSLWLMSQQNGLLCGTTEDLVLKRFAEPFFQPGRRGIRSGQRPFSALRRGGADRVRRSCRRPVATVGPECADAKRLCGAVRRGR